MNPLYSQHGWLYIQIYIYINISPYSIAILHTYLHYIYAHYVYSMQAHTHTVTHTYIYRCIYIIYILHTRSGNVLQFAVEAMAHLNLVR